MYNLIFFVLLLGCANKKSGEISIIWSDQQAKSISIPKTLTGTTDDSLESKLTVRLAKEGNLTPIAGIFQKNDEAILFEPIIPFTRGLSYEILVDNKVVSEFSVPKADQKDSPELLSIYPVADTLPENLLKMHLRFSKPMREGKSIQQLTLVKNDTDTLRGTFLDLQPELWNEDGTILTVWLDPGRIKRDLTPNRELGTPLQANAHYTLYVSNQWKDKTGASLTKTFQKDFVTTLRDSISPHPKTWTIQAPTLNSTQPLVVRFYEVLDYNLVNSTLRLVDKTNKDIKGKWQLSDAGDEISFIPDTQWSEKYYQLQVESRLEDLCGNNINRAFDVNVKHKSTLATSEEMITIPIVIQK